MDNRTPEEIIYEQYQDIFDYTKKVIESSSEALIGKKLDSLPKAITTFHYIRAINLLDAISILCVKGYGAEAMIILRSLFNLCINLKWLTHEDIDTRMTRFADFEAIYKKLDFDATYEYISSSRKISRDDFTVHDKDFERVKAQYGLKSNKDLHEWSGKSIFQMAMDVSLDRQYKVVYSNLSELEHTGPASVRKYLDDSEQGITYIKVGARNEYIDVALLTSLQYFLPVKRITYEMFDMKMDTLETEYRQLRDLDLKYHND